MDFIRSFHLAQYYSIPEIQDDQPQIQGLRMISGFRCILCSHGSQFKTRHLPEMKRHVGKQHKQAPKDHTSLSPFWNECMLQTLFSSKRRIRYFSVIPHIQANTQNHGVTTRGSTAVTTFLDNTISSACSQMVLQQEGDDIVEEFNCHKSAVIPWLQTTGIAQYLKDNSKELIRTSYQLPTKSRTSETKSSNCNIDRDSSNLESNSYHTLEKMLRTMEHLLRQTLSWCLPGENCRITRQRQLILGQFWTGTSLHDTAFNPFKQENTIHKYITIWKQLLAFCLHVTCDKHFESNPGRFYHTSGVPYVFTSKQQSSFQKCQDSAKNGNEAHLQIALLEFCKSLICHTVGTCQYDSALVSYCAMLALNPHTKAWHNPGSYNSNLSAIIWIVQLIIIRKCCNEETDQGLEFTDLLKHYCSKYLRQDSETSVGYLLNWRLYLFKLSAELISTHHATWSLDGQTITYGDTQLQLNDIHEMVKSEWQQACQLLYSQLMFDAPDVPRMQSTTLYDNTTQCNIGWSFIHDYRNASLLQGSNVALLLRLKKLPMLHNLFFVTNQSGQLNWRMHAIAMYEATVQQFLRHLLVLLYITTGPPVRAPELLATTWCNTQRNRHVFIQQKLVMLHLFYHKKQQELGRYKETVRFIPAPIGQLLLDYLVYVIPMRQILLQQQETPAIVSPYIWADGDTVWVDQQVSKCLEQACYLAKTPCITVAPYRQIATAIIKRKFSKQLDWFDMENINAKNTLLETRMEDIMHGQSNHNSWSAQQMYANQTSLGFANIWDRMIQQSYGASQLWAHLFGFDSLDENWLIQNNGCHATSTVGWPLLRKVALATAPEKHTWSGIRLLNAMRQLYQQQDIQWKSDEQQLAMVKVMSPVEQLVVVMGTGAGKSLLFMLPPSLPKCGVTILIVPLVALRQDLLQRIKNLGLLVLIWSIGETRQAPLVLVSIEAAGTSSFCEYLMYLESRHNLDRIVLDECHLMITAKEYRHRIMNLAILRKVKTQFVYLTATLPPSLEKSFIQIAHLRQPQIVRASTNRANICYKVVQKDTSKSLVKSVAAELLDLLNCPPFEMRSYDKIMCFTRGKEEARTLGQELLNCPVYTSDLEVAQKETILQRWKSDPACCFIVGTSALGTGLDYAHVRIVAHIGEPYSLIDFVQESGRAGRDGRVSTSIVFLQNTSQKQLLSDDDNIALVDYLEGKQCRRKSLTNYLDAPEFHQFCTVTDQACDICIRQQTDKTFELPFTKSIWQTEVMQHTGAVIIAERANQKHLEQQEYFQLLQAFVGTCMICRITKQQEWQHDLISCSQRAGFFAAKKQVLSICKKGQRKWISEYQVCYRCYNPQWICRQPGSCQYRDLVMPLCYGIYLSGKSNWIQQQTGQIYNTIEEYLLGMGKTVEFGGEPAIQGVKLAAAAMNMMI